MKEVNLKLTDNEYRALEIMIQNGHFACESSCVYPEMTEDNASCSECPYTKANEQLEELFK